MHTTKYEILYYIYCTRSFIDKDKMNLIPTLTFTAVPELLAGTDRDKAEMKNDWVRG